MEPRQPTSKLSGQELSLADSRSIRRIVHEMNRCELPIRDGIHPLDPKWDDNEYQ